MTIQPGQPIPAVPVKHVTIGGVADATADKVLGQGKVVMFTVPGAFTPTCHQNHLPGYLAAVDQFKAAGVDKIVCAAANDYHVVKAWAETTGALDSIEFISDGIAALARQLGLEQDMSESGMGIRFGRHALIIVDGIVKHVANEKVRGEVTATGAAAILEELAAL
jgi:glutaredoxin/glutathione-dependent peroxiredoxin